MIGVIVQARMSSARLPGKVLLEVGGKPLLAYLLERLARARQPDITIVATSDESDDDPVAELASGLGVPVHRGPLGDVAGRLAAAADSFGLDALVRISGDSPLMDPAIVDRAVELFSAGDLDLVTNVFPRSFPVGESVEVLSREALARMLAASSDRGDREHVTRYVDAHPESFRIRNFDYERDESAVRLAVDSEEDLRRIEAIVAAMTQPHTEYGLAELLRLQRGDDH
jgi:spore coat polysaccharide biosynthesis protein SpsF (cytidylyltransferase family)